MSSRTTHVFVPEIDQTLNKKNRSHSVLIETDSWARWLVPVIAVLGEAEVGGSRSGVRDQPGQYGETPFLLKIQKLAGHGGTCL